MTNKFSRIGRLGLPALVSLALVGCAVVPRGPSYPALPGTGKSLQQLHLDDDYCRSWSQQVAEGRRTRDGDPVAAGAALGTALGAIAGAALGGRDGAAAGAVTGVVLGTAIGTEEGRYLVRDMQQLYDETYTKCMYDLGHRVAVQARQDLPATPPPSSAPPTTIRRIPPPPPPNLPPRRDD